MQIIDPTYITDARLIASDIPESTVDIPEWDETYSYVTGQRAAVIDPGVHKIYECIWHTPDCLNKYPLDYLTGVQPLWLLVSATNLWKLFDMIVAPARCNVEANVFAAMWDAGISWEPNTSWEDTTYASLKVSLEPGLIDALALLNLDCTSMTAIMTDPVEGEVYNQNLIASVTTGYNGVYTGLPEYPDAILDVIIRNTTGDVNVGELVVGRARTIGKARYGVGVSLVDYSAKEQDVYGNFSILERAFSKRLDCTFSTPLATHSQILRLLEKYRSVPLVWIISTLYSTTIAYGFYRDLQVSIPFGSNVEGSVTIEGLGADFIHAEPIPDDWVPVWDGIIYLVVPGVPTVGDPVLSVIEEAPVAMDPIAITVPDVPTVAATLTVYEMIGNCTISNAEPLVVTYAGHGLLEDDKIKLFNTMVLSITDSSCVEANGTRALIFSGGGTPSAQATGTYTVVSNVITAVSITTGGTGYSSAPTVATQTGDGAVVATLGDWRGSAVHSIYYNGSGSLNLPLASNTVYFVIYIDENTFQLSLTVAGSPIDAASAGWGIHTLYKEVA